MYPVIIMTLSAVLLLGWGGHVIPRMVRLWRLTK